MVRVGRTFIGEASGGDLIAAFDTNRAVRPCGVGRHIQINILKASRLGARGHVRSVKLRLWTATRNAGP